MAGRCNHDPPTNNRAMRDCGYLLRRDRRCRNLWDLRAATTQRSAYMDNTEGQGLERVIVAKLIVPRDALQGMAEKMLAPTDLEKMESPGAAVVRLVN